MIRVGLGYDIHPFADDGSRRWCSAAYASTVAGSPVTPTPTRSCHAVADALLGPAGLPDLGTLFPASDDTLPRRVVDRAAARRRAAGRRRRLVRRQRRRRDQRRGAAARAAPRRDASRTSTPVLGDAHVSVTPKRGEGIGTVGRGEGIAVWAVALDSESALSGVRDADALPSIRHGPDPRHAAARHGGARRHVSRARSRCTCADRPSTTSPHVGHAPHCAWCST